MNRLSHAIALVWGPPQIAGTERLAVGRPTPGGRGLHCGLLGAAFGFLQQLRGQARGLLSCIRPTPLGYPGTWPSEIDGPSRVAQAIPKGSCSVIFPDICNGHGTLHAVIGEISIGSAHELDAERAFF